MYYTEIIEELRKRFSVMIDEVMEKAGHNLETTDFILTSALDLALSDERNEFYK